MPRFLIKNETQIDSQVSITGQDAKHICKVLRLAKGDLLELTNGDGLDFKARIINIIPGKVDLEIIESYDSLTESPVQIAVCSGMLKDKKMDMVIRHLTELGITQWIPFFCERSVPTPDAKRIQTRIPRWQTIAKEAIKQCQRSRIPEVKSPVSFEKLLDLSNAFDTKIAFWEKSAQKIDTLISDKNAEHHKIMILIGPEGGFSEIEIEQAKQNGFTAYSLGPRILRAETASFAACTLVQHILGDI